MTWHGIDGHDEQVKWFRRALERERLANSFLFVGPEGIGKRTFALKLAQALLCSTRAEAELEPCGQCPACVQVSAGTHPDLKQIAKPPEKSDIPVALLIGDRQHRGREGLCHDISLKPFMGGRKFALIDDADSLNAEGANCLLKTLEEPPPRSVLILIGTSPAKQLPTIRSRCQLIRFRPLPLETVAKLLLAQGMVTDPADAQRLAAYSNGSLQRAVELSDPDLWIFRNTLLEHLSRSKLDSAKLAQAVSAFVDEAGKQAAMRRARLNQVIDFAVGFYRQLLHATSGTFSSDDQDLQRFVEGATRCENVDRTAARLDRCLEAIGQVNRNANQTTLIETWLDDLTVCRNSIS